MSDQSTMKHGKIAALLTAGAIVSAVSAQEIQILPLGPDSVLAWTNASLCVTCRVEWAAAVEGPWHSDWESLTTIVMTTHTARRSVPRFFRVACSPARPQMVTTITSAAALTLITNRHDDPAFLVLDVRTPGEYVGSHIRGATNLNFYSSTFQADLSQMNRCNAYVVYCASGSRSGQARQLMLTLGFMEVYDMGGFSSFTLVPGSQDWIEP